MDRNQYLDALLTLPRLYNPIVSPNGEWVAWTVLGAGAAGDVYAAATNGSGEPVRLTETDEMTLTVSWAPDSRSVLVQQDHEGNERAVLYRVQLDQPLIMEPLTEESPAYFLRGGKLHPNGRWLVYAANFDTATGQEIEATWLYRHDLQTGERIPLACPQKPAYYAPEMNEQGTHILYNRKDLDPSGEQVWMVDIEGREDREVLNFGPDKKVEASWFPDGRRVLFVAEAGAYNRVGVWDRESGETRWVLDNATRNIEGAYVPHGSDKAVIREVREARSHATLLDVDTGEETKLPDVRGNLIPIAPVGNDGDANEWVMLYYSSRQPVDLVRSSLHATGTAQFASLNKVWKQTKLEPDDLVRAESFSWKSVDGLEIQGWLYRTRGDAQGTIVYVHGGPTAHSEDRLNPEIQFYVSQGFNVLDPNYRGSTGFSLEFRDAIKKEGWGGKEQEDISTGIRTLIREGIAQPGKVGITGTSYGGYSAWCAITHCQPSIVAAAAPVCGMTDLVVDYETTRPDLRPYSEEMMGGNPQQVPERYFNGSPINFVGNIKGRLLIVQGLQDPNVSPENVRTVRDALDKAGIRYEVAVFEDEGHGIKRTANRRTLYLRLLDFFGEAFTGGPAKTRG